MLIRIRYTTGTYDYIKPVVLANLIRRKAIIQFFRSGDWVTIGVDPIRIAGTSSAYLGPERRR